MVKIKRIIINIAVFMLNVFYLPFKMLKTKNKITYISRESNEVPLDFRLLRDFIQKEDPKLKQVIISKKIGKGIIEKVKYGISIVWQMYHIATSKVVIVDTYVIPVSVLKHKRSLKVIQIWHAMGAIKKFGYQIIGKTEGSSKVVADSMKMHRNYDAVTCTSRVTAKFYSEAFNTLITNCKIIGMPRVDYILNGDKNDEILKLNPRYKNKKTILYIPTFRKNKTVFLDDIIKYVDKNKYNLIIKLHPLDNTKICDEYLVKGNFITYDLMKFADYIITDYSATAIEASLLEKPLYLYTYDIEEYEENRGLNVKLTEELKSSTFISFKDIMKSIDSNNYNYDELNRFRNKYIETYNVNNTEKIYEFIKTYL